MKIVLLGHEDIASAFAHDMLVSALPEHDFVAFWSPPVAAKETGHPALRDLADFDRQLFDDYLERKPTAVALKHAGYLPNPNTADGLQALADARPALVVSIRYRKILRDDAIAIPGFGVLNLHSGILPDYRGVMATFWAMLHGEQEIGATLHRIVDAGIDTGPVVDIVRRAVNYKGSYLSNVLSLYDDGCRSVAETIRKIARGEAVNCAKQPSGDGQYFSSPAPADVDEFLRKGLKLADHGDRALLLR